MKFFREVKVDCHFAERGICILKSYRKERYVQVQKDTFTCFSLAFAFRDRGLADGCHPGEGFLEQAHVSSVKEASNGQACLNVLSLPVPLALPL